MKGASHKRLLMVWLHLHETSRIEQKNIKQKVYPLPRIGEWERTGRQSRVTASELVRVKKMLYNWSWRWSHNSWAYWKMLNYVTQIGELNGMWISNSIKLLKHKQKQSKWIERCHTLSLVPEQKWHSTLKLCLTTIPSAVLE